jgi:Na+-driven multidrug efflux pump
LVQGAVGIAFGWVAIAVLYGFTGVWWAMPAFLVALYGWGWAARRRRRREGLD